MHRFTFSCDDEFVKGFLLTSMLCKMQNGNIFFKSKFYLWTLNSFIEDGDETKRAKTNVVWCRKIGTGREHSGTSIKILSTLLHLVKKPVTMNHCKYIWLITCDWSHHSPSSIALLYFFLTLYFVKAQLIVHRNDTSRNCDHDKKASISVNHLSNFYISTNHSIFHRNPYRKIQLFLNVHNLNLLLSY